MVAIMIYKANSKKFSVKGRGKYMSKADFIAQYYMDMERCQDFFFDMKWPDGYACECCGCESFYYMPSKKCYRCARCRHDERLLSKTIFKDCKLALNVLLYGLFLIFTDKRGLSSMELAEELKVNYKTACLLNTKCRILMREANESRCLDSAFYESDVAYTGAPSGNGKRGMGTEKQPFLIVLATRAEGEYPTFVKLKEIESDRGDIIKGFFDEYVVTGNKRLLNTDGKTTYNVLKEEMAVKNEPIDYESDDRRLYFLDKVVSNFNSCLLHVYHGIGKKMLPLYYAEYEWRFNHRNLKDALGRIREYVALSEINTKNMIKEKMNQYLLDRSVNFA